jgi:chromate transporter
VTDDCRVGLRTVARTFLRFGIVGFGGPAAHIALMQDELVDRRAWISRQAFTDALGVTNLVPGPNSSEMAIHIGYLVAGRTGGLVAGVCFALPAVVMMTALAALYFGLGRLGVPADALAGLQAAAVVVIVFALWRLRGTVSRVVPAAVAAGAFALTLWLPRWSAVWVLAGGSATLLERAIERRGDARGERGAAMTAAAAAMAVALVAALGIAQLPSLAWVFLKTGALLFGGGYVLVPLLEPEILAHGWLTKAQFLDGIALGQATPGPIVTTAAFVGFRVTGVLGALVATVAIYLPAFLVVLAASGPFLRSLRGNPAVRTAASGFNAAAFGAIAASAISLGRVGLSTPFRIAVAIAAAAALWRKAPVWAVLLGALVVGVIASAVR